MTLDEAKRVIDRAWNAGPRAIDWNEVEEASMVIVAETGAVYEPPDHHDLFARRRRPFARAPKVVAPSSRGTPSGYDTAVRQPNYAQVGPLPVEASTRPERPRYRPVAEQEAYRDLLDRDEKPPGWP